MPCELAGAAGAAVAVPAEGAVVAAGGEGGVEVDAVALRQL